LPNFREAFKITFRAIGSENTKGKMEKQIAAMDVSLDDWQPFKPLEVFQQFAGINAPWCIVGGWAIDLWLGRQTRIHEDIEISILREDLNQFRAALPDCDFFAAGSGKITALKGDDPQPDIHQVWCLDRETKKWRLDIMIEPGTRADGGYSTWRYRRQPTITIARDHMIIKDGNGVPFMRPDCVLLFKAKHNRSKDQLDFESVLDHASNSFDWFVSPHGDLEWLENKLEELHPDHKWLNQMRLRTNLTI
jgi:hypothetical protein